MITIIDASNEILCNNEKEQNEVLTMINATVSHEIRNPLNSIVAINIQKDKLYKELKSIIFDSSLNSTIKKEKTKKLFEKLEVGKNVQQASTKLIQYLV